MLCHKRMISAFMCATLLLSLTGCSTKKEAAPELLEPVTSTRLYRPVVKQEVNEEKYYVATVVPKVYSQFYTFSGSIARLHVSEGDRVKKGDLIAELETKETEKNKDRLVQQMNYESVIRSKQAAVDSLELKLQKENKASKKELSLAKEQARYNQSMTGASSQRAATQKADEELRLSETKLYADHDGVVCYTRDLELSSDISCGETVAMIADFDEPYLEVNGLKMDDDDYKDATQVYVQSKDEKILLEPYDYTSKELAYMASVNAYPNAMYQVPKELATALGEQWVLHFVIKKGEKGCYIGLDSLQQQGQDFFCMVKTNAGEEKRSITIGEKLNHQVQVLEGLQEGDEVAYQNVSLMPDGNNTITVENADYTASMSGGKSEHKKEAMLKCTAPMTGEVSKIYVEAQQQVKAGDPIYSIKQVAEHSDLMAVNAQSARAQKQHKDTIDSYDQEIAGLTKQKNKNSSKLKKLKSSKTTKKSSYKQGDSPKGKTSNNKQSNKKEIKQLKKENKILDIQIDLLKAQKELENANYQMDSLNTQWQIADIKNENDGSGEKVIRANCDGTISSISVIEGSNAKAGQTAYTLAIACNKHLVVKLSEASDITSSNMPKLGDTLTYTTADGEFIGVCVTNHLQSLEQIVTKDSQVYKTFGADFMSRIFIMESALDQDEKDTCPSEIQYLGQNVKETCVLPTNAIASEEDLQTAQTVYFVWKVVNGSVVKQYVKIDESMLKGERVIVYDGVKAGDVIATRS